MTDKPLEWGGRVAVVENLAYIVWIDKTAWWTWKDADHFHPVPGPYDGTIETAKQRCEEHRRRVSNG